MPSVTVNGSGGGYVVVNYDTVAYQMLAQSLAGADTPTGYIVTAAGSSTIPSGADTVVGIGSTSSTAGLGAVTVLDSNTAGAQVILTGNGTDVNFAAAGGSGTVLAGDGNSMFTFTAGDWQLNNTPNSENTTLVGGSGYDVFAAGAGDSTVIAGTGNLFAFGSTGAITYDLSSGTAYLVAGPGGSETMNGGTGVITVAGTDNAAVTFSGAADGNLFIAGSGNETLNAAGSTGANLFFAGTGEDSITAGSGNDFLFGGPGDSTLTGGAGNNIFAFVDQTGGSLSQDTITDWNSSSTLELINGVAIGTQTVSNGDLIVGLTDGTTVTFTGVTSDLNPSQVFSFG